MLHKHPGTHGHDGPEHSKLNKAGRGSRKHYTDTGTMHSAPHKSHPGEGGWVDKHEATRHNRRSPKSNLFH
jgi:hypothetical protein